MSVNANVDRRDRMSACARCADMMERSAAPKGVGGACSDAQPWSGDSRGKDVLSNRHQAGPAGRSRRSKADPSRDGCRPGRRRMRKRPPSRDGPRRLGRRLKLSMRRRRGGALKQRRPRSWRVRDMGRCRRKAFLASVPSSSAWWWREATAGLTVSGWPDSNRGPLVSPTQNELRRPRRHWSLIVEFSSCIDISRRQLSILRFEGVIGQH